jgi:hypothetical protein
MKNTGIVYHSTERTPTVLAELAGLLPPLSGEQLAALEADLLQNGCYSPVIVNEELVIVDGHNRQSLCEKHGIPYNMAVFAFDDLLEAKQWALDTQKGRRNLDKWELGKIALKLKPEIEAKAKANMSAGGQAYHPSEEGSATLPNLPPVDTRKELADSVGLGERTMGKVMQIDEHAPAAVKEAHAAAISKKSFFIQDCYLIFIMFRIERSALRRTSSSSTISGDSFSRHAQMFSSVTIFMYLQSLHPQVSSSGGAGINVLPG